MKLYRSKIPFIAHDVVATLAQDKDIEVQPDKIREVELDVKAILEQYLKADDDVRARAKDLLEQRGLPATELGKIRKIVAEERSHKLGDDGMDWILNQVLEGFMVSPNVEEVWSDDPPMRKKMADIFRRHLVEDEDLDREVRGRLKHVQEGTPTWDIEYEKVLREVRQKRGLI